jgi:hypothetical protein
MKFQVRADFVVRIINKVDLGDGKFDLQENSFFGGQMLDIPAEQADLHAHKLEPKDKAAEAYLAAKTAPQPPGQALGLTPESLALVQALATEIASKVMAAAKAPATAAA